MSCALTYKIHAMPDGSISSLPRNSSASTWVRWALPSASDMIFVVLLGSLCLTGLADKMLGDAGIGWHIRTGQQILSTHHIPRVDPYSSIVSGKPWIAWEWLYDVIVGALDSAVGLNGVVWLNAVLIAATFALTFQSMIRRGTKLFAAVVLILLAISASMIHVLARPHVLTWLFVVIWFRILDDSEQESTAGKITARSRWLWLLPVFMVIWVNLHGGFLLGLLLCALFWCSALWYWQTTARTFDDTLLRLACSKRVRDLSAVTLLCAAATFVNPYGWALHRHILSYLRNPFLMDHIEEFQSPNFHQLAPRCFLVLLLVTFAALPIRKRAFKASEVLLLLFAIYAGLFASRNLPVASILLVLVVGPLLPPIPVFSKFSKRMTSVDSTLRGHTWVIVAVVFVLLVDFNGGRFAGKVLAKAHFDPSRMPVAAVDHLETMGISDPVLTPDWWGGYVIYRLYPRSKIVLDDRHDLYGEQILSSYLKMYRAQPGWDDFLRDHNIRCVLMPRSAAISAMLSQTPGWKSVYSDDVAIMFIKQ
jgi:hypothetical protein